MTDINFTQLAIAFVSVYKDELHKSATSVLKKVYKEGIQSIRLRLESTYVSYLQKAGEKYGITKSFFFRNKPVSLYDFYVPIDVKCEEAVIQNPGFSNLTSKCNRIIIEGLGGCGKSILMKHLFVDCIIEKRRIPIFVELRTLNDTKDSLMQAILDSLNLEHDSFDMHYLNSAIKLSHFSFFLDGFDEVEKKRAKKLKNEITALSRKAGQCPIFISSRPAESISGINEFSVFNVGALSIDSSCELISKLRYCEDSVKERFIRELRSGSFEKDHSFLTNPLLLCIMLLTYSENAEVPLKRSIFFDQAYNALFHRHDAFKEGYKRDRRTKLDIREFSNVFEAFSFVTYNDRKTHFSKSKAFDYLTQVQEISSAEFSKEDFLIDAKQAVCLLFEDGTDMAFTHRSFQEYFVALYIKNLQDGKIQKELVARYAPYCFDNVIDLLYEMDDYLVEKVLYIPILQDFLGAIGIRRNLGMLHFVRYLKLCFNSFEIGCNNLSPSFAIIGEDHRLDIILSAIKNVYGDTHLKELEKNRKQFSGFIAKYKKEDSRRSFPTKRLTRNHEFVHDLIRIEFSYISINFLQMAFDLHNALKRKHARKFNGLKKVMMPKRDLKQ